MPDSHMDQLSSDLASLRIDRTAPPRSWGWLYALVAVGALGAAAFFGYERIAARVFKMDVATTTVILVSPAQGTTELTGVGYVVAQRQSKVACQILSRIAEMRVVEGQSVEKDEVLFRVEDAPQRAAASAVRARALAARSRVAAARALLAEIRQQQRRETGLAEQGFGTQSLIEDLRERLNAQDAAIAAADLEAKAVEEDVRSAEVQLAFATVRAPFAGVVRGKPLDVGELLGTFNEKPAVDLYDPATLLAEIDVPEKRLEKVRIDGPAEVVLEAYPETRFRAVVVEVGSQVDRSKGTMIAKLRLLERPERFLPDMRARANFLAEELDVEAAKAPPKTVVPKSAVAERGGAKVVFRIEEGRARMVPVALGPEMAGGFEVRSGPAPGTVLVADPPATLSDGQPVKEKSK